MLIKFTQLLRLAVAGAAAATLSTAAVAGLITATAAGGVVPENSAAGASFSLNIAQGETITGVSFDLFNFVRNGTSFLPPSGGIVELVMTLQHVDTGTTATIISHPLNTAGFICVAGMNGDYHFDSAAATTLGAACGSGDVFNQPLVIAPGDFAPNSNLASLFDGESSAGTWRLFVSDTILNTGAGQFVTNRDWRWGVNIETATAVPEPGTLALVLLAAAAATGVRRRRD